jgi:DNA repair photolyase
MDSDKWNGPHEMIECKRAISPSKLPGIDYALNPYGGCSHGCLYCYAPELTHADWSKWNVVKVKTNIAERMGKEIRNIHGVVGVGTVTDPYQSAELRFELTRTCMKILKDKNIRVHVHTKSNVILRDLDILTGMQGDFAVTITSLDPKVSKIIEPGAPSPEKRLDTLKELTEAGLDTYALTGPVLDILNGKEKEFVDAIVSTGTKRMYLDRLNERPLLADRMNSAGIKGSRAVLERIRNVAKAAGLKVYDVF